MQCSSFVFLQKQESRIPALSVASDTVLGRRELGPDKKVEGKSKSRNYQKRTSAALTFGRVLALQLFGGFKQESVPIITPQTQALILSKLQELQIE